MGLSTGNRVDPEEPGVLALTDQRVLWASKALGSGGGVDFRSDPITTVESSKEAMRGHTLKLSTTATEEKNDRPSLRDRLRAKRQQQRQHAADQAFRGARVRATLGVTRAA